MQIPYDSAGGKELVKIRKSAGGQEFIPEIKSSGQAILGFVHGQIREPGWYDVIRGEKIISGTAFNYDRKESNLDCYSTLEIKDIISKHNFKNLFVINPAGIPLTRQVEQMNMGTPLEMVYHYGPYIHCFRNFNRPVFKIMNRINPIFFEKEIQLLTFFPKPNFGSPGSFQRLKSVKFFYTFVNFFYTSVKIFYTFFTVKNVIVLIFNIIKFWHDICFCKR